MPIGALFDELWRAREPDMSFGEPSQPSLPSQPTGRGVGNIGKLTLGVLPRAEYARHAVVCAFVRFLHPDLYFADDVRDEMRT